MGYEACVTTQANDQVAEPGAAEIKIVVTVREFGHLNVSHRSTAGNVCGKLGHFHPICTRRQSHRGTSGQKNAASDCEEKPMNVPNHTQASL